MAPTPTTKGRARKGLSYPLPEQVQAGKWTISATDQPRVDITARNLYVNLKADQQNANVRAHELGHIQFSDPKMVVKGISPMAVQTCEDLRINYLLRTRAGVDLSAGAPPHIVEGAALATKESPKLACSMLLADLIGYDEPQILPFLGLHWDPNQVATFRQIMGDAIRLFAGKTFPDSHHATKPWSSKRCLQVARWFDAIWAEDGNPKEESPYAPMMDGSEDGAYDESSGLSWGKMTLEQPPLTHHADRYLKRPRAVDVGDVPVQPWRVTTDQRIFRFKKPSRKGTIVIDGSGSMHLDADTIATMARMAPAATIAAYHGEGNNGGPLRILAVNGKIADPKSDAYEFGGGNIIDGPVLKWLSTQPQPRIWVCDGQVTGRGDSIDVGLTEEANAIMRAGGIVRVRMCDDATRLFSGKRHTTAVYRGCSHSSRIGG